MLQRLSITNLATISALTIEFDAGFTVLTGETGAGKSILIDAIRFVLGARASTDQMRSGAQHTAVEAVFDVSALAEVTDVLEALEIPCDGELILRRVLQASGRSRALANDTTVTQGKLEQIGTYLVNIHGQHDNQMLLQADTHIRFLDAFGRLDAQRREVAERHRAYTQALRERRRLQEAAERRARRREELQAAVEELDEARLSAEEETQLQEEAHVLSHAERLVQLTEQACLELYEEEGAALTRLQAVERLLEEAQGYDRSLADLAEPVAPLRFQLEDLHRALRSYTTRLDVDPARLEHVNARLAQIERLKRRYGGEVTELLAFRDEAERELEQLGADDEALEELGRTLGELAEGLHRSAAELSRQRGQTAAALDEQVLAQLHELGMPHAVFETRVSDPRGEGERPQYTAQGMDQVEFLISTNPGQPPRPLSRIASGGELSRTMLALKTVLARTDPTRTLIFDEVDAGVSGAMAEIVGRKLRGLGATHQVLCVTHLPQIAALGQHHLLVAKDTDGTQTYTHVTALEREHKVREVARLLSGIDVSERSVASAEELVNRGQ